MCGIAGWVGKSQDPRRDLVRLAYPLMSRGKDAGGIGTFYKGTQTIWKQPGPIGNLFLNGQFDELADMASEADVVFIHTRLATHGTPLDNRNNHPIRGDKYILMHNGIVHPKQTRSAIGQTDSEQLLRAIEELGIIGGIENTPGSKAIALYDVKENICTLYRNVLPLFIAEDNAAVYFSSQSITLRLLCPNRHIMDMKPFLTYEITP